MKRWPIFLLATVSLLSFSAPPGVLRTNITLGIDYGTNGYSTNWIIEIRASTNLSIPATNWPIVLVVPGTNSAVTLPIDAAQTFYIGNTSNWWGRSPFSFVVGTQPIPPDGQLSVGP